MRNHLLLGEANPKGSLFFREFAESLEANDRAGCEERLGLKVELTSGFRFRLVGDCDDKLFLFPDFDLLEA